MNYKIYDKKAIYYYREDLEVMRKYLNYSSISEMIAKEYKKQGSLHKLGKLIGRSKHFCEYHLPRMGVALNSRGGANHKKHQKENANEKAKS